MRGVAWQIQPGELLSAGVHASCSWARVEVIQCTRNSTRPFPIIASRWRSFRGQVPDASTVHAALCFRSQHNNGVYSDDQRVQVARRPTTCCGPCAGTWREFGVSGDGRVSRSFDGNVAVFLCDRRDQTGRSARGLMEKTSSASPTWIMTDEKRWLGRRKSMRRRRLTCGWSLCRQRKLRK